MNAPLISSLDLTGMQTVPFSEIAGDFEALLLDGREERVDALDGLLIGRTLWRLKEGTRQDALDDALHLARILESEIGRKVKVLNPIAYGAWHGYCELLGEGARRSDPVFVDTLLRSTSGYGEQILDRLAAAEEPIPRARLRETLTDSESRLISESNLSHLLRNLEEGELVLRTRRGREVFVELGRIGQRIVEQRLRPAWLEFFLKAMASRSAGSANNATREPSSANDWGHKLIELGVPSNSIAEQMGHLLHRFRQQPAESSRGPYPRLVVEDRKGKLGRCSADRSASTGWAPTAELPEEASQLG